MKKGHWVIIGVGLVAAVLAYKWMSGRRRAGPAAMPPPPTAVAQFARRY